MGELATRMVWIQSHDMHHDIVSCIHTVHVAGCSLQLIDHDYNFDNSIIQKYIIIPKNTVYYVLHLN